MKYRAKTHPLHTAILLHQAKGNAFLREQILKAQPHVVDAYPIAKVGDPLVVDEPMGRDFTDEVKKLTEHRLPRPGDYWVIYGDGLLILHRKEVFEAKYEPHLVGDGHTDDAPALQALIDHGAT